MCARGGGGGGAAAGGDVSNVKASLVLMKSLNKTETPIV